MEFDKPMVHGGEVEYQAETRASALWVLHRALLLLHPIMPFLTEELWQQTGEGQAPLITLAPWPRFADSPVDAATAATLGWVVRLIGQVRAGRHEMNATHGPGSTHTGNATITHDKARLGDTD